ncbi:MAG: biopolymer transporter ExbD [Planctomycetota bacterium]
MNERRFRRRERRSVDINMAPLIDLIFLLLIFFMVSTSFFRQTGVDVERPRALTSEDVDTDTVYVAVTAAGSVHMEEQRVPLVALRDRVERALARSRRKTVVVLADVASRTGLVVDVMDECRLAGAERVFIATRAEEGSG